MIMLCVVVAMLAMGSEAHVVHKKSTSIFASIAAKLNPVKASMEHNRAILSNEITTGIFQAKSYVNSLTCGGSEYAVEYLTLSVCSPYSANYSDPDSIPMSCGGYVSATATLNTTLSMIYLNYNFYKDALCTVPGESNLTMGCVRSYGNALCAPQAEVFIRAAMQCGMGGRT